MSKRMIVQSEAIFDYLSLINSIRPNVHTMVAVNRIKSIGGEKKTICAAVAELNADGSIKDEFCRTEIPNIDPSECAALDVNQYPLYCTLMAVSSTGGNDIWIYKPAGTYFYGIKVWGKDEGEPDYPSIGTTLANVASWEVKCDTQGVKCDTLTVVALSEIKAKVHEFYNKAKEEGWRGFYIRFTTGSIPYLCYAKPCGDLTQPQRTFITDLGFTLFDNADGRCHILYEGRELTRDELWLTDMKHKAMDLGLDVRDYSQPEHDNWGFFGGPTVDDMWKEVDKFYRATGIGGGMRGFEVAGGWIGLWRTIDANLDANKL